MCVCVCVCVCTCVCVKQQYPNGLSISLLMERSQVHYPTGAVVSLSKELCSHCYSPPICINVDLVLAGEVNAKLFISHLCG